ncbi:PREDICTED: transmembrane 9 superfamily member 2-like, partial [Diuraphis noxia]|uniref:transmembrane 9 superfamily member 2-like n=1 Tax=Diuraphis noxia TaxID=143948 RepID=UPI00076362AA
MNSASIVWFLGLCSTYVSAFYLPGLAPVNYCKESAPSCTNKIEFFVNRLNSDESVIPYEYHYFDFCTTDESKSPTENLGQVLFGERIRPSGYN